MVRVSSLSSTILVNHLQKCRCCLKTFGRKNKQQRITKTIETRFLEITSLELKILPGYSNSICVPCNNELKRISEFRNELIFKQKFLAEHVEAEAHQEEFVKIKVEPDLEAYDALEDSKNLEPVVVKSEIFDDTFSDVDAQELTPPSSPKPAVKQKKKKRRRPTVDLFCDHCGYKTVIKDTLKSHVTTHIPKEFREKFSCTICDADFISKQRLKSHTEEHLKKTEGFSVDSVFSCDLCSRHFASKTKLTNHKTNKHKDNRVECKICGRSMFDKNVLKKHMKKFHKDDIDESILTCIERGKKATAWIRNVKEEVKVPKKKQISTKPVETRICDSCGKMVNRTAFHSHMRRQHHDGSKKFECDRCPAFYFLKERVVQHMVKHVSQESRQRHQCHICHRTFVSRLGRANHIKLQHETTEKNFKCQFCEKLFLSAINMKAHIARVHESRKNLCEYCNRGFVEKHELKKHILQHHSDHPGYYCDSCGRLLPTLAALRNHKRNIHEERRFACEHPGCDKKYSLPSYLKIHQKSHENIKNFTCNYPNCEKSYLNNQKLRRHIGLVHENIRKPCPIDGCNFSVGRADYMRNHLMKHSELEESEKQELLKIIKEMGLL